MQKVTTQDMVSLLNEIGEQVVVAMVERGDGEEHDPIMEMLARKVQIINAIAERVNEMTAVEYLEAREEICNRHYRVGDCAPCPFNGAVCLLWRMERGEHRRAVEIVKKWKEEQHD